MSVQHYHKIILVIVIVAIGSISSLYATTLESQSHLLWQVRLISELGQLGLFQRLEIRKSHNVSDINVGNWTNVK